MWALSHFEQLVSELNSIVGPFSAVTELEKGLVNSVFQHRDAINTLLNFPLSMPVFCDTTVPDMAFLKKIREREREYGCACLECSCVQIRGQSSDLCTSVSAS